MFIHPLRTEMDVDGARAQVHWQQSKFKTSLSYMKPYVKKKEGMKEEERHERQKEKRRRWRRKRILFLTSHPPTTYVEEQGLQDTLVA